MATIHDVALRAGVSPKTVSRELKDHDSVKARTRERVRVAMNAVGAWNTKEAAGKISVPYLAQHSLVIRESKGPVRKACAGRAIHPVPAINVGVTDTIWEVA